MRARVSDSSIKVSERCVCVCPCVLCMYSSPRTFVILVRFFSISNEIAVIRLCMMWVQHVKCERKIIKIHSAMWLNRTFFPTSFFIFAVNSCIVFRGIDVFLKKNNILIESYVCVFCRHNSLARTKKRRTNRETKQITGDVSKNSVWPNKRKNLEFCRWMCGLIKF